MPNKKRLIRKRNKANVAENVIPAPLKEAVPIQNQPLPEPKIEIQRPLNILECLLYDNTNVNNISINNVKRGEIQIFLEGEIEPRTVKLPKPIAHLLRMSYRAGLNDSKVIQKPAVTISGEEGDEELFEAANEMVQFLYKLGNCHGDTEEKLIEAVRKYKLKRR